MDSEQRPANGVEGRLNRVPPLVGAAARLVARWQVWLIGACCLAPFAGLLVPDGRCPPDARSRDFVAYQVPIRQYARAEMLAGRFPLWVPYLGAGLPLHAGQQASLCHPLMTPLVLLFGAEYGLKLCLFLHLAIGYAGMYWLARYHDISRAASNMAAVLTTWSGFDVCHLMAGHVPLVIQYALVPWLFLSLAALLGRPTPLRAAALAGIAACLAVSGHPQIMYYTVLFAGLWAAGSLLVGAAGEAPVRCVAFGLASVSLALLLAAVQLVPSLELAADGIGESFRGRSDFASTYAMTGLDMVRLVAPNIAGNPFLRFEPRLSSTFHERVVYLGLAAPLLAVFGLSRGNPARWQWGAASLAVFSLAIALGDSTPVFGLLPCFLPGLGLFRCPGRVFGVASMLIALLAAGGLDSLTRGERAGSGSRWVRLAALIGSLIGLAAYALAEDKDGLGWRGYLDYAQTNSASEALVPAVVAADSLAVLFFAWRLGPACPRIAYVLALFLAFVDLGWSNIRNFRLERPARVALPRSLVDRAPPPRFVEASDGTRVSDEQLRYSRLVPAALSARRSLLGTNEGGVLPAATERLCRALEMNSHVALAVAGCDFACSPIDGHCEPLDEPLPRVRFLADSIATIIDVPIENLRDEDVLQMRAAMVGTVRVVEDGPQRIAIDVDAPTAGRLVLADTWYPGWKATVDGQQTAIARAHGAFRSLAVPEGPHRVVFRYDPLSFRLGLAGTFVGLVLWSALAVFGFRQCGANALLGPAGGAAASRASQTATPANAAHPGDRHLLRRQSSDLSADTPPAAHDALFAGGKWVEAMLEHPSAPAVAAG